MMAPCDREVRLRCCSKYAPLSHRGGVHISLALRFRDGQQAVHHPERHRRTVVARLERLLDQTVHNLTGQPMARAKRADSADNKHGGSATRQRRGGGVLREVSSRERSFRTQGGDITYLCLHYGLYTIALSYMVEMFLEK